MKQETHEYQNGIVLRSEEGGEDGRIVEGYAILFGVRSTVVGYDIKRDIPLYEVIEPTALTREYLDTQDIVLNLSHNNERMLARSVNGKGTLSYDVDEKGVKFRAELPHTVDGDYALEHIRLGNLANCSFAFTITRDNYELEKTKDEEGNDITVAHVKSFCSVNDMAIVRHGAYPQTSVYTRAELYLEDLEQMKEEKKREEEIQREENKKSVNYREEVKALRKIAESAFDF